ncbi:MAG: ribose-phosphate diphosphokinase [Spirochaetaceae bacterium]|nr:ribose-phosphate diphosphokinase [Spirochaetaceae bacterium]
MSYSEPTRLAVVACPGGEVFADAVIARIEDIYKRRSNTSKNAVSFKKPDFKVKTNFTYFMNGEFKAEIMESIRGKEVFIFQDMENHQKLAMNEGKNLLELSVNDHLMAMLVTIDAVRQAGADKITLVVPAYPYSRQHKKKGREGLTAALLGHILEFMSVDRIITLDIHSREIVNAFSKTHLENLHASYQIIRELGKLLGKTGELENLTVVSPDTGAIDRNKFYSSGLKKPLAMIYKERDYAVVSQNGKENNIKTIKLLGEVGGRVAFLADDLLGTGGTLLKAMEFLKEQGASKVIAAISLPFFTGNAIALFDEAYSAGLFYRIIGTNAVHHADLKSREWYVDTDVSGLFASVVMRLYENRSVSSLLDNRLVIERLIKMSPQTTEEQTGLFDELVEADTAKQ